MLDVKKVTVSFDEKTVLKNVDLTVAENEIVALHGPSGSGKSTLLRVIAGLLVPDSGSIYLEDQDISHVPAHRRHIGMVFQDNQLFPHRNVEQNIEFGLRMNSMPKAERKIRVEQMLDLVGLSGFENRSVINLSGGEAKRIALARSLAPQPRVLLLDEPLTGLDRDLHDQLANDLAQLLRATKTTTILVTHDRDEAQSVADRSIDFVNKAV